MKFLICFVLILIVPVVHVAADPVIDPSSIKNRDKYYRDDAQCKAIAKDSGKGAGNIAKDTAIGAGVGAGTGALLGVIGGKTGKKAGIGAVVGGVAGGGMSVYKNSKEKDRVYKNCMRGRGYKVLN